MHRRRGNAQSTSSILDASSAAPSTSSRGGQVIVVAQALVVVVNAQTKLDHAVDAACELRRLIEIEAGGEQGRVEKEPNQILHGLVRFVGGCLFLQFCHNGVL